MIELTPQIAGFLAIVVVIRFTWPLAESIVELLSELGKYIVIRKDAPTPTVEEK